MASDQVQMYQISKPEKTENKENVILRTIVGDPNRHKPLAQHTAPSTIAAQEALPASMYTLETRYRPIPPKVLPQPTKSKVNYLESQKLEENSVPNPVKMQEEPEATLPVEQEIQKNIEQEPPQTVFLEPKIILQPILYSIVGAKNLPIENNQPIPTTTTTTNEIPLPILYNLVASPRRHVRIQEPVKEVSEMPQQSSSTLHAVVGNPHVQLPIQEPVQNTSQIPRQTLPILYSIVANPTYASHLTYTSSPDLPPLTQPIKDSSVQLVPILYTIVGETQVPNNISVENRPPLRPIKRHANDATTYAVVGGPRTPKSMTIPQKTQPLEPQKQQQPQPLEPKKQQPQLQSRPPKQQQALAPALYPLVGKPTSPPKENINTQPKPPEREKTPPKENIDTQSKPPVRKKTPPKTLTSTRRVSRSLERKSAPEPRTEPTTSMPPIKKKRQPRSKEPTIPKSETVFYPLPDNERTPRSKQPRISPEQANRQPYQIANYNPLRLPDYISPYAYHPLKPYREQTVHPTTLPLITNNRSPRKPRPLLDEPHHRTERKYFYDPRTPHSLERYPVRPEGRSRLWDYEYEAGTDVDDDDMNGSNSYRKRGRYRRYRPRSPWIPVW